MSLDRDSMTIQVKHLDNNSKEIFFKKKERENLNDIEKEARNVKEKIERLNNELFLKPRKVNKIKGKLKGNNNNTLKVMNENINITDQNDINEMMNKNLENSILILQNIIPNSNDNDDENYDPSKPNNYETIIYERKLKHKEEELKDRLKKSQEQKNQKNIKQINNEEYISNFNYYKDDKRPNNENNLILNNNNCHDYHKEIDNENFQNKKKISTEEKVKNMLGKMGWKGQGLGKYEQGMKSPLIAKKIGEKVGVIVNSSLVSEETFNIKEYYNIEPTKIILLTNIANIEELDDELLIEVKEECSKFGEIINSKLYVYKNNQVPEDETVRIFIEFMSVDMAKVCFEHLFERYFAGKVIHVRFYPEGIYRRNVLDSFEI